MPSGARLVSSVRRSEPKFVRRSFVEMMFCNLSLQNALKAIPRSDVIARDDHLAGDFGVATFVGFPERGMAGPGM
jgi:hypothetical protein